MKWLVELEDGERLEVGYVSLPPGTLTVPLTENCLLYTSPSPRDS